MADECPLPDALDERLCEILLQYLESAESGEPRDPEELLALYPEFAPELREFLETRDRVEELAAPLRWVARALQDERLCPGDTPNPAPDGNTLAGGRSRKKRKQSIGDYDILEEIGRGGMGVVCKARQRTLNRLVAIKMVTGGGPGGEDVLRRFCNEAETVAALDHPSIVPIYEVGEEDGELFFSMKLLEGGSLKDRLETFAGDPQAAARLVATIARAVGYAHHRGVLHRDLKPSNVLLDAEGRPHVTDFGLAKWLDGASDLTQTGALLGTPSYMAPEQASPYPRPRPGNDASPGRGSNNAVTTAADVYGLGAVLYALLTGRPPFQGSTTLDTLESVRDAAPVPPRTINPRVSRDLETVCLKCLEKEPSRRYNSAEDLADELERWLGGSPVLARRASGPRRLWLWGRRHPAGAALAATVAVFVPVLIATLAASVVIVGRERDRALAQEARALAQETRAEQREREVRQELYAGDMVLAHREWLRGDVNGMGRVLERWRPHAGEEDLRDIAWRLLDPLRHADPLAAPAVDRAHRSDVYRVAYSPDGRTLASAGKDGAVRLVTAGKEPVFLPGHHGEVNWVEFDNKGRRLATASDDGTARVWDVSTGRPLLELPCPRTEVTAACFSPDGEMLLTTGHEGSVRAWQLPSGKVVWEKRAGTARISELAFAPNGQRFAMAGTDGLVRVWETESGKQLFERRVPGQCLCVAYGPKGYRFAVGDTGGNLWLFGAEEGEQLVLLACDHGCPVEGVAFAPDAKTLVTCGGRGRVRLWDLQSNTLLRNLDCEDVRVWCVTFSPDNRAIVCGAADGAIRTWNTANANAARFLPAAAGNGGPSIAFSPDGRTLAVAAPDGSVSFWDPATCQRRTAMESLQLDKPGRHLVRYQPSGAGLGTCGPDGSLQSWGQDGRLSGQLPGSGSAGLSLCCRPGTSEWLSRRGDGPPVLWDAASGRRLPWKHGDEPCSAAAWSADGSMLALAYPRRVKLIRTGSRDPLEFVLPERASDVTAVAFSPDGSTLAAAEFGGIIRLCDTAGGKVLRVLEGRQLGVEGLAFSPAGNILATGDREGRVKVWYVASGRELFNLAAHRGSRICELAFAPDGSSLAAACVDHNGADEVALWPASAP